MRVYDKTLFEYILGLMVAKHKQDIVLFIIFEIISPGSHYGLKVFCYSCGVADI